MSSVLSVNVGLPRDEEWAGNLRRTAIDKRRVPGPVRVSTEGLAGDQVADTVHHGGPHKAVYAFAREDLDVWAGRVGHDLRDGVFGENLTTVGIDVNGAVLGERWRIGDVLLEVSEVRIPCVVFKNWLTLAGVDSQGWMKRFTREARPGPYLRVLEEGSLREGDSIIVEHRPGHGVTASAMFRALTTDRSLLPDLLEVDTLPPAVRRTVEKRLEELPALPTHR